MRGGINKAVEYLLEQRSPQLLIVDISGVDMPLSKIQELAEVCEPGTNVVAIGDHNDIGLYRDLIDSGVSNYIVKPLTRELLERVLNPKSTQDLGSKLKLGKVISFIGARGGVGSTTIAANFAWQLAKNGRRVALVDLDLQRGDCAMLFNVEITQGFRDALQNPLRLDAILLDRIMTKVDERLFLLGSMEPLDDTVQFTVAATDALLAVLRSQFHYVVLDMPATTGPAFRRALEMSDRRIIIVDPTMRSMRDGVRIARLFESDNRNSFVVNRSGEGNQHALPLKEITKVLQTSAISVFPFAPKVVMPAAHHGIVAASKRGKFADAVGTLAVEISGRQQQRSWLPWRRK
jgi:pilus assembly protein CpaE